MNERVHALHRHRRGRPGSNLADTLTQHHDVVIIDNLATAPGRVKIDHPRVTFFEGSITDLDLLMEVFPGADGIFGGDPLRAPVGEGPARLERGKRDRHRQGARGGEGLRRARRRRRLILLGLQRHPGPLWVNGTRKLLYIGDSGGCGRHMPAVRNCPDTATGICA